LLPLQVMQTIDEDAGRKGDSPIAQGRVSPQQLQAAARVLRCWTNEGRQPDGRPGASLQAIDDAVCSSIDSSRFEADR
jgi:hypothetical protein